MPPFKFPSLPTFTFNLPLPKFKLPNWCLIDTNSEPLNGWITSLLDGTRKHYKDDQLHSTDSPAVILPNGEQEFWCRGEKQESLEDCIIKDIIE